MRPGGAGPWRLVEEGRSWRTNASSGYGSESRNWAGSTSPRARGAAHGISLAALAQPVELPEAEPRAQRGDGQRDEQAREVAPAEPHGPRSSASLATRGNRFSAASLRCAADRLSCRSSYTSRTGRRARV